MLLELGWSSVQDVLGAFSGAEDDQSSVSRRDAARCFGGTASHAPLPHGRQPMPIVRWHGVYMSTEKLREKQTRLIPLASGGWGWAGPLSYLGREKRVHSAVSACDQEVLAVSCSAGRWGLVSGSCGLEAGPGCSCRLLFLTQPPPLLTMEPQHHTYRLLPAWGAGRQGLGDSLTCPPACPRLPLQN